MPPRSAAVGIPEAWLIDLGEDRVEHHREPSAEGYRRTDVVLPEVAIPVSAIIPPR